MSERLQKIISRAGLASRREADRMIEQGRVTVNGEIAEVGQKADPHEDEIVVDGSILPRAERMQYIAFYKPRGVLSAIQPDPDIDLQIITDIVKVKERVYPVGRLDVNSEGLMLLTNDGDLTHKITHPRYEHAKTYKVSLKENVPGDKLAAWQRGGIQLEDGFITGPCKIIVLEQSRRETVLRVVMQEGHKRQIRETAEKLGLSVDRLIRTHIGPLALGDLPPGQWRYLNQDEINALKNLSNKPKPRKRKRKRR